MNLGLDKIKIDCGTQARANIRTDIVDNYAEALLDGAKFPAITVYFDGDHYYLADGFHRYLANVKAGSPNIDCDVVNGSLRDAILFSLSANFDHGLHRSNADKRKAVETMLQDFEWTEWSDREIASRCKVSARLVATIRQEMGLEKTEVKFERDGKVLKMEKPAKQKIEKFPLEHVREAADDEKEQLFEAVDLLKAENEALNDRLAVISSSPEQADREMANSLIADLRAQLRAAHAELSIVKQMRDTYQSEKAQLMKQNATLQRKLKQYEGKQ